MERFSSGLYASKESFHVVLDLSDRKDSKKLSLPSFAEVDREDFCLFFDITRCDREKFFEGVGFFFHFEKFGLRVHV